MREGRTEPAVIVDHVKEIADGGDPYDWDNLQSLCLPCHNRKTAAERRRRAGGGGESKLQAPCRRQRWEPLK